MAVTFKVIQTITVGAGGVGSIVFSSIPQTYTDLCIKYSLRNAQSAARMNINLQYNSISTGYTSVYLSGANGGSGSASNATGSGYSYIGEIGAATNASNTFSIGEIYLPNYTSSLTKGSLVENLMAGSSDVFGSTISAFNNTSAAITQITIVPGTANIVQYSTATLYGITKA